MNDFIHIDSDDLKNGYRAISKPLCSGLHIIFSTSEVLQTFIETIPIEDVPLYLDSKVSILQEVWDYENESWSSPASGDYLWKYFIKQRLRNEYSS